MRIDIFAKNLELTDPIKVFIENKIGGLEKLFKPNDNVSARVEISRTTKRHKSGEVFYAEANFNAGGQLLRANAEDLDVRNAITNVKDALKIEIKKFKERKKDLKRKPKK
ncbi:MAG: ribosomal subunit interface protein [Candidatus Yanofskybacteria bacterium RIFOXYD1_FULL_44_17]|uniref:Ribosomal subunit interface protein n=1 Tax=Candidatus Yanofskybacteria bacterium GW2011_GWE2_40_11 TaxID=1619033 RepID=A0A0G0QK56_9BACT|nr:MAG: hypothetical protein UT69_C0011G0014 [Candidatus Yanofskybacteria bacterium GW2011_GWE1_40_10]KKR40754.1 MAG: hypothetical protein UT75_C0005G0062 [Candidatus Yanofskybacteria bacterium GW2011_GWE2_40_11]OGN36036.1 MAG: ribosomal subunit interface protein [Candidatus Yanofskybacteria bacterium RIFOXYA1_FULL_44_17]OGN36362.1 MAG: ribosomal subunit interface protein [Candidatus Yanofskybacteria bacterium RIFOXYA2_FULL_45_28]OGN37459.1 MAG: ribosomal subunit interface protein [Candidatus Y